jgi:hypothetical protein
MRQVTLVTRRERRGAAEHDAERAARHHVKSVTLTSFLLLKLL